MPAHPVSSATLSNPKTTFASSKTGANMNQQRKLLLALAFPVLAVFMQGTSTSLYAQDFELPSISDLNAGIDLPTNPLPGGPLTSTLPKIGSPQGSSLRGEVIKALTPAEAPSLTPATAPSLTPADAPSPSTILKEPTPALSGSSSRRSSIVEGSGSVDADSDVLFDESSFDDEVYQGQVYEGEVVDGQVYEGVVESTLYQTSSVIGLSSLGFRRNYGDDVLLSSGDGDSLTTGDADHRQIGGFEAYFQVRASTGVGWEFRYFGLDPSGNTASLGSSPTTVLVGLNNVAEAVGDPSVADFFNAGNFHALTRESSIYNIEFNILRNRSDAGWFNGVLGNFETLVGFRYVDFDESLQFASGSDVGTGPRSLAFNSSVENSLIGGQVGGRSEFNVFNKLGASIGGKFGLFYTSARANRSISGSFADGSSFDPNIVDGTTTIQGFDFGSSESDASFLAEIDLGLIYQFSRSSRVRLGYRLIGISGVAHASDNIPDDVSNVSQLQATNDSGNLRLRGIYFSYELGF